MGDRIEIATIEPPSRAFDEGRVRALVESIKEVGQLTPVLVELIDNDDDRVDGAVYHFRLVAGVNRLEALKRLGKNHVWGETREWIERESRPNKPPWQGADREIHSGLARIDENLVRSHLDAVEQGLLIKQRADLTGTKLGSGGPRKGAGAKPAKHPPKTRGAARKRSDGPADGGNQNDTASRNQVRPKDQHPGEHGGAREGAGRPESATKAAATVAGVSQRTAQRAVAEVDKSSGATTTKPRSRSSKSRKVNTAPLESSERVMAWQVAWGNVPEGPRSKLQKAGEELTDTERDWCWNWSFRP